MHRKRYFSVVTTQAHWERVYTQKEPSEVSWCEPWPDQSLELIESLGLPPDAPIIDVGGGASRLAEALLERGYGELTVADISPAALARAQAGLGDRASEVNWVVADVLKHEFGRRFAVWHDRAAFHFMVSPEDQRSYRRVLEQSLAPNGHILIATFGPDGPTSCSGLPVARYGPAELVSAFEGSMRLVSSHLAEHSTPAGNPQQFLYAHLQLEAASG